MKEKATLNLSLEGAWIKLKRQFKGKQWITKIAIVEMTLDICVGEFEEKNDESLLYTKLADLQNTEAFLDKIRSNNGDFAYREKPWCFAKESCPSSKAQRRSIS